MKKTKGLTQVFRDELINCDFCDQIAGYDAKTTTGPWASMCEDCYSKKRFYKELGLGKGQKIVYTRRLVTKE